MHSNCLWYILQIHFADVDFPRDSEIRLRTTPGVTDVYQKGCKIKFSGSVGVNEETGAV